MAVSGNPDTFTAAIRQYAQTLLTDMHMHRARRARVLLRAPVARGGRPPRSRVFGAAARACLVTWEAVEHAAAGKYAVKFTAFKHRSVIN